MVKPLLLAQLNSWQVGLVSKRMLNGFMLVTLA